MMLPPLAAPPRRWRPPSPVDGGMSLPLARPRYRRGHPPPSFLDGGMSLPLGLVCFFWVAGRLPALDGWGGGYDEGVLTFRCALPGATWAASTSPLAVAAASRGRRAGV